MKCHALNGDEFIWHQSARTVRFVSFLHFIFPVSLIYFGLIAISLRIHHFLCSTSFYCQLLANIFFERAQFKQQFGRLHNSNENIKSANTLWRRCEHKLVNKEIGCFVRAFVSLAPALSTLCESKFNKFYALRYRFDGLRIEDEICVCRVAITWEETVIEQMNRSDDKDAKENVAGNFPVCVSADR